ncbi:MAG: hypothetical protein F6K63_16745 [Moorea sp. SIO1G6]|uniref:hypothetical protein n=1 Tax=Moorena sp. SIO1G6 TaxID=2607840 RepID=UPI0013C1BC3B|nr:hypothetical protein [Moorena sp. SIO1G6]NET65942.1 hypothetical protein [Moorena sp. SIO1G6]
MRHENLSIGVTLRKSSAIITDYKLVRNNISIQPSALGRQPLAVSPWPSALGHAT